VFVECRTFRHRGHYEGENPHYWDPEERQRWLDNDPVTRTRERLLAAALDEPAIVAIETRVMERIDEAVAFAEASPFPDPTDALLDVFAEGPTR
jgi:pyruvate dehydrogenase E1 component alpha subunit